MSRDDFLNNDVARSREELRWRLKITTAMNAAAAVERRGNEAMRMI